MHVASRAAGLLGLLRLPLLTLAPLVDHRQRCALADLQASERVWVDGRAAQPAQRLDAGVIQPGGAGSIPVCAGETSRRGESRDGPPIHGR
jgi:hypothetical protein